MKNISLSTVLLLLLSWTASFAQTGKPISDTTKCYGLKELQYISSSLVAGRACDTSLANANAKLLNRINFIKEKEVEITALNEQLSLSNKIILKKEEDIKAINLHLDKEKRKHKWTKFGWGATSVLLGALVVGVALN